MDKAESEKQFTALVAFTKSISRPFRNLKWPWPTMPEPEAYREWRECASIRRRMVLYTDAGLPVSTEMATLHLAVMVEESEARAAWDLKKFVLELQALAGLTDKMPWM